MGSTSYHQQSNEKRTMYKILKYTMKMKKWKKTNDYINIALLQITSTAFGLWLPNPAKILLSIPIMGQMPRVSSMSHNYDYDKANYNTVKS